MAAHTAVAAVILLAFLSSSLVVTDLVTDHLYFVVSFTQLFDFTVPAKGTAGRWDRPCNQAFRSHSKQSLMGGLLRHALYPINPVFSPFLQLQRLCHPLGDLLSRAWPYYRGINSGYRVR